MYKLGTYSIPTSLSEMTLQQFEHVSTILQDGDRMEVEKYLDLIEYFGVPTEVINTITDDQLFKLVSKFTKSKLGTKLIDHVVVNHTKYVAYTPPDQFKLLAKDLALIERAIKSDKPSIVYTLAVIFKPANYDPSTVYLPDQIEARIKDLSTIKADKLYPYIMWISNKVATKTKQLVDVYQAQFTK